MNINDFEHEMGKLQHVADEVDKVNRVTKQIEETAEVSNEIVRFQKLSGSFEIPMGFEDAFLRISKSKAKTWSEATESEAADCETPPESEVLRVFLDQLVAEIAVAVGEPTEEISQMDIPAIGKLLKEKLKRQTCNDVMYRIAGEIEDAKQWPKSKWVEETGFSGTSVTSAKAWRTFQPDRELRDAVKDHIKSEKRRR